MRPLGMTGAAAALALLAGCAAQQTQATPPTVSFNYVDGDSYRQAAREADDYCLEKYRANAYLLQRAKTGSGYQATFSCE